MTRRPSRQRPAFPLRAGWGFVVAAAAAAAPAFAQSTLPVTPQQRSTAQQVAQQGVPFEELAPEAPDSYTVKSGDTLWRISGLYLRRPWRWPELWGMNLAEIRNPHLIYPGQMLYLDRSEGRARLRLAQPVGGTGGTVKLSPRVRSGPVTNDAISSVPMHLIAPFLSEAVVFSSDELATAPRVVAAPDSRVLVARGDLAYVRGELGGVRDWRLFREARPLRDPETNEVLGYEGRFVGTAEYVRAGETLLAKDGKDTLVVPSTVRVTSNREEIGVGDRLSPVPARDFGSYAPHAPERPMNGRIVSVYGDALGAGQNQIVVLNRGSGDGIERGHVLALWKRGETVVDRSGTDRAVMQLPDERHGLLFVFSVFERVSYALILQVQVPVRAGDRFTQPD